jgi:hypothetical protein
MIYVVGSIDRLARHIDQPLLKELRSRVGDTNVTYLDAGLRTDDALDPSALWSTEYAMQQWTRTTQLRPVSGDTVVFCDFWNPAISFLSYYRWASGSDVHVYAIFPASSRVPGDFASAIPGAALLEDGWGAGCDEVFCPSEFAARYAPTTTTAIITGLPLTLPTTPIKTDRERLVLFPHRATNDKGAIQASTILRLLLDTDAKVRVWMSQELPTEAEVGWALYGDRVEIGWKSEAGYFDLCERASVVLCTPPSETFGYAWMQAAVRGCGVSAIWAGCYPEYVRKEDLAKDEMELFGRVLTHLNRAATDVQQSTDEYRSRFRLHFSNVSERWANRILR